MPAPHSLACDVVTALSDRTRRHAAEPLLTWYDIEAGARAEFSTRTFANWVDKTVNLFDELDLVGEPIVNTLLVDHGLHWVTAVTTMAIWQCGGTVVVTKDPVPHAAGVIVGPTAPTAWDITTIACSLHPLGAGLPAVPAGVSDYVEVLAQPDVHQVFEPTSPVCLVDDVEHTWAEANAVPGSGERMVINRADDPWELVTSTLIAPLLGGGSVVLIERGTPESIEDICRQERAIHA